MKNVEKVVVANADRLFISGQWAVPMTDAKIDVVSPATEEVIATVAAPSFQDADLAVSAARKTFDKGPWPRMTLGERIAVCRRFAEAMERRREDLALAWVAESGPTIRYANLVMDLSIDLWKSVFDIASTINFEERRETAGSDVLLRREPIGTVLAILTFNGPTNLLGMKVLPALVVGCPVIVKPAVESQLTMRIAAECAADAGFPDGVLSILAADVEVSQYLVGHKDIDMVAVTGGTQIATDVVHRTADRLARTEFELGGKSPAIIAEDADIELVLKTLVPASTRHCGQVCVSPSRILAPESRYEEIVDALSKLWKAIRVGDPMDPASDLGPMGNKRGVERTERFLKGALEQGAKVAAGGRRPEGFDKGWYFLPTLLRDVDNSMTVAQEEVFGPITCVIPYKDMEDAVRIANDTKYGLAAYVYSADHEAAVEIARRIRSGVVGVNLAGFSRREPFGGFKQSGWGRECGAEGILGFTDIKQVCLGVGPKYNPSAY